MKVSEAISAFQGVTCDGRSKGKRFCCPRCVLADFGWTCVVVVFQTCVIIEVFVHYVRFSPSRRKHSANRKISWKILFANIDRWALKIVVQHTKAQNFSKNICKLVPCKSFHYGAQQSNLAEKTAVKIILFLLTCTCYMSRDDSQWALCVMTS